MKFIISRLELSTLLSKLQNVVSTRTTTPILSHFLLEAANDELILSATDLTVAIRCYTDTKVIREGAITLPVRRMAQLVRELTAVNLEITTSDQHRVEIAADSSRFKLHGMSKEDFPALPDFEGAARFTIKQHVLKDMLFRTAFSVSREDNRYVLTGVYMNIADGTATFVGTDGKRLSRAHIQLDDIDKEFKGSYTIPLKAVDEIVRNLSDDETEIATLYLLDDRIAVECSQLTVITKLLTGDYPDYNTVIPNRSEVAISLHAQELASLLRQISLFTRDPTHSVRFTLTEGDLQVSANSSDIGEGHVSMPANYQGPKLEIAFNPGYFLDILRHCRNEVVSLAISDAFTPGLVTDRDQSPTETQAESPLFVLMPMRLNES